MSSHRVALVTCGSLRELNDDDRPLLLELWNLGIAAEPAVWDDPSAAWGSYDAAVIRSAWDYHLTPAAFLAWLERLEALGVAIWNPAAVVRANADKSYLKELEAAGVGVVPTAWVKPGGGKNLDEILAARGVPLGRTRLLASQQKLQLAELERLEAAPRLQPVAKREELERRHRLQHVNLRHDHLEDREHALERVQRARRVPRFQQRVQVVQLVQHLLEPQLVHLVDDDEQGLVVLRPIGHRSLATEQLVEPQITRIRERHRPPLEGHSNRGV